MGKVRVVARKKRRAAEVGGGNVAMKIARAIAASQLIATVDVQRAAYWLDRYAERLEPGRGGARARRDEAESAAGDGDPPPAGSG